MFVFNIYSIYVNSSFQNKKLYEGIYISCKIYFCYNWSLGMWEELKSKN